MDAEQILAFRLARSGLDSRRATGLAAAAACPASDFTRDAALLAIAARTESVSRESYRRATDSGDLVVAHALRGAIHAVDPADWGLHGRALIAADDDELGAQLGRQVQLLCAERGLAAGAALAAVTSATTDALSDGRRLDRNQLHEHLRGRLPGDLLPWCRGCESHHVAPMLWRYATIAAGARLDSERRYVAGALVASAPAVDIVRRFLGFYGPGKPGELAQWAGLAGAHARRLWDAAAAELVEVRVGRSRGWVLREDVGALESPPAARGIRLLPPGDPYLQPANRPLLAPDPELRRRLFRPVASPGAVLSDGRLAGLWRARLKGARTEVTVEALSPLSAAGLDDEAQRVAALRGAAEAVILAA